MFQEADVVAVILWLAEYYGAKAEIAAKCCRRIELLCQGIGSEANCEAAVNAGGCSAVVAALSLHSDDAAVRDTGRAALRAIASGGAAFRSAALAAGAANDWL